MSEILKSATKITLLIFTITLSIGFLYGVFFGGIVVETKDFLIPAMAVLGFFFAYKGDVTKPFVGK